MKLDLKTIPVKLTPCLNIVRKYIVFAFLIFLICSLSFLIFRINLLTAREPTDDQVNEKLETVTRPKIDEASIKKLQQLQDQNVQVQSLFDQARNNPFDETAEN